MKTLAVFLCLLVCLITYGQLSVDSIKTEKDIEAFVKQYGEQHWPNWRVNFYNQADSSYRAESEGRPDSVRYIKWYIEDFNNDGKKDLIFSNINNYSSASRLFSLISKPNGTYEYFNLWKSYYQYQTFDFEIFKKDSSTLLLLTENKFSQRDSITTFHFIKSDTLLAAYGGFVESRRKINSQMTFDTIEFWYDRHPAFLWATPMPHGMHITVTAKNGMIKYEEYGCTNWPTNDEMEKGISEDLSVETVFQSDVLVSEIREMLSLANLKQRNYLDSLIDHPDRVTIKIKSRKKQVEIIDDGLQSSYWVNLFSTKMLAISKKLRGDMARYFSQYDFSL